MTQLYQMLNSFGIGQNQMPTQMPQVQPMNMFQMANSIMQAMRNPATFIKQCFPDIPDNISNNPDMILSYLQKTRGITNEQIQDCTNKGQGLMRQFGWH